MKQPVAAYQTIIRSCGGRVRPTKPMWHCSSVCSPAMPGMDALAGPLAPTLQLQSWPKRVVPVELSTFSNVLVKPNELPATSGNGCPTRLSIATRLSMPSMAAYWLDIRERIFSGMTPAQLRPVAVVLKAPLAPATLVCSSRH